MDTNPYAPPSAPVADIAPIGLKRRSVLLMIVFSIVTLGLYYSIWFIRRREALNRLDSPRKLQLWPFVLAISWFVFQFLLGAASGAAGQPVVGDGAAAILTLVRLGVGILMVVQCFFTKDILEDHFASPGDQVTTPLFADAYRLSGVMTFIFQIFYLQYAINRYLADSKSAAV